jgi:hypothetical protein
MTQPNAAAHASTGHISRRAFLGLSLAASSTLDVFIIKILAK